jgi:hypothetical protein
MKVTKVTKTYYVVNGEKVFFFEPISISKRKVQALLNQSERLVICGMCEGYIHCKEDVRPLTPACKKFKSCRKTLSKICMEMNEEYEEKR